MVPTEDAAITLPIPLVAVLVVFTSSRLILKLGL
jgi:hypothetical protein